VVGGSVEEVPFADEGEGVVNTEVGEMDGEKEGEIVEEEKEGCVEDGEVETDADALVLVGKVGVRVGKKE
jgi:hypothetical protein